MMRAFSSRLSVSVTMTSSAPSTTCALVMMKPSALRMKPEPTPRCCCGSSSLSGRRALLRPLLAVGPVGHRDAEAAEELFHVRVHAAALRAAVARALGGADVDDRRADALDQLGEVGQLHHRRGGLRVPCRGPQRGAGQQQRCQAQCGAPGPGGGGAGSSSPVHGVERVQCRLAREERARNGQSVAVRPQMGLSDGAARRRRRPSAWRQARRPSR